MPQQIGGRTAVGGWRPQEPGLGWPRVRRSASRPTRGDPSGRPSGVRLARASANLYRAPYVRRGSLNRSAAIVGSACVRWSIPSEMQALSDFTGRPQESRDAVDAADVRKEAVLGSMPIRSSSATWPVTQRLRCSFCYGWAWMREMVLVVWLVAQIAGPAGAIA
jgi:hypothetical protein